jgi:hypothetical protein
VRSIAHTGTKRESEFSLLINFSWGIVIETVIKMVCSEQREGRGSISTDAQVVVLASRCCSLFAGPCRVRCPPSLLAMVVFSSRLASSHQHYRLVRECPSRPECLWPPRSSYVSALLRLGRNHLWCAAPCCLYFRRCGEPVVESGNIRYGALTGTPSEASV